jgi:hypothetical protein
VAPAIRTYGFGRFEFHDRFVIAELAEGIDVGAAIVDQAIAAMREHFAERPFGYISNRIHHYSVDPLQTRRGVAELPMAGVAVVAPMSAVIALELGFYRCPARAFVALDEAVRWVEGLLG